MACAIENGRKQTRNTMRMGARCFTTNRAVRLSFGMKVRCVCLRIAPRKVMMSAGSTVSVQMTPSRTPFAITRPMSMPSVRRMVHSARKPAIVVKELAEIEEKVFCTARTIAVSSSAPPSRSSSKRCRRKIEKSIVTPSCKTVASASVM